MVRNELVAKVFCKGYGAGKPIFENADFRMESGHIYGLVAPNGSGKTTLMRCIAGTSNFTGEICYNGVEVGSHFNGKIVHSPSVPLFEDSRLKVIEYLRSITILRGIKFGDALEKLRKSSVSHFENSICGELSTGQKKVFQLFLDFLPNPEVVLLDEPLNGLDRRMRNSVISNLSLLARQGKIILISTHVFSDVEDLTDEFFIIKDGILNFYEGKGISELYDRMFPSKSENEEDINF